MTVYAVWIWWNEYPEVSDSSTLDSLWDTYAKAYTAANDARIKFQGRIVAVTIDLVELNKPYPVRKILLPTKG